VADFGQISSWYAKNRAEQVIASLKKRQMNGYFAKSAAEAKDLALSLIPPGSEVGLGGSLTVTQIGLMDALIAGDYKLFNQYESGIDREESLRRRKLGSQAEYYVSGCNAVTLSGVLINQDGTGNRVAAFCFGPKKVIHLLGYNKIVPDVAAGLLRLRQWTAPANARRLELPTPCGADAICHDCDSERRICNYTLIQEFSLVPDRTHVIIIGEVLGL
jgi:hypothetical protein